MIAVIFMSLVVIALFPWGWRKWVEWRYAPATYSAEEYSASDTAPRIAIVFGARVYRNERLSAMLRDRVDTAIDLYFAGKVD